MSDPEPPKTTKMYVLRHKITGQYFRRHYQNGWFGQREAARLYKTVEGTAATLTRRQNLVLAAVLVTIEDTSL